MGEHLEKGEGQAGHGGAEMAGAAPVALNYAGGIGKPERPKLVTIRRGPTVEMEMARVKLEADGIPATVIDQNAGGTSLALLQSAQLQVFETDMASAEVCLSRVASDDAEGEYVEEEYRCPKCHKKNVEFLPRTPAGRNLMTLFLILLMLPIVPIALSFLLPPADVKRALGGDSDVPWLAWMLVEAVLAMVLWLPKRGKRCKECGMEWGRGAKPHAAERT